MNFVASGVVLFLTWICFGIPVLGFTGLWIFEGGILLFFSYIYFASYRKDKGEIESYRLELSRKAPQP